MITSEPFRIHSGNKFLMFYLGWERRKSWHYRTSVEYYTWDCLFFCVNNLFIKSYRALKSKISSELPMRWKKKGYRFIIQIQSFWKVLTSDSFLVYGYMSMPLNLSGDQMSSQGQKYLTFLPIYSSLLRQLHSHTLLNLEGQFRTVPQNNLSTCKYTGGNLEKTHVNTERTCPWASQDH